jgi:type IV secretion system protein VirD4
VSTTVGASRHHNSLSTSMTIVLAWVACAAIVAGLLLHLAVLATARITSHPAPGPKDTVEAIRDSPINPVAGYPSPVGPAVLVYVLLTVLLLAVGIGGFWVVMLVAERTRNRRTGRTTPKDLRPMHEAAAVKRARETLPAAAVEATPARLLVGLGSLRGTPLCGQHEDSYCVVAPARSGRTMSLAVPWVLDAPGPVVATGTKNDLAYLTAGPRELVGQVLAMDPADVAGWPHRLRWNPVVGCLDPDEALQRGRAWAAGDPGRVTGRTSEWFSARAGEVLAYLLHAAALKPGGSMRDVRRWSADLADDEPVRLLAESPRADEVGWADLLKASTRPGAGETVDAVRMTLSGLLAPLTSPRVLDAVCPPEGERFDVEDFLSGPNTLYLLSGHGAGNVAPLMTMLTDHVLRCAWRLSQRCPDRRLWPPLRLVLDEAANVTPLPELPTLMSNAGGRGITTMVICQSFAQMDERWGHEGAEAMRANATVGMYLPGIKEVDQLRELSEATGRYRAAPASYSTGRAHGSVPTGNEWADVMTVDDIRRMPVGTGLLFYRGLKAAHVNLTPWWDRADAEAIRSGKEHVEKLTGRTMQ